MKDEEHRDGLPAGLRSRLGVLYPGARVCWAEQLGTGEVGDAGETTKGLGYGRPIRVVLEGVGGRHDLVFHTASPDVFGHDRRSDRVAEMLLAWDTFGRVPGHVEAIDVGMIDASGQLATLSTSTEAYLLTRWAEGAPYAHDLRRVAAEGTASESDLARVRALAALLARIHATPGEHTGSYVRAWRDLVGSGEGIAGIADGYGSGGRGGADVPGASVARIARIEERCLAFRHRHRHRAERLTRTHGDFHPFNILFDGETPVLLDTSRGSEGEPADDVACLAINFLFFGLGHRDGWREGLGRLYRAFLDRYAELRPDPGLFDVIAPFFAWRGLVVTSPAWYPQMTGPDRDRVLSFVERVLESDRFEPSMMEEALLGDARP